MFYLKRYHPEIHNRHSIRLKGWDYSSPGSYFITICTIRRGYFFGNVKNGIMKMNSYGVIVNDAWYDLAEYHPHISLDAFVVMPDHVHGIIIINPPHNAGAGHEPAPCECHPQSPNVGAGLRPAPCECHPQPQTGAGYGPAPTKPVAGHHALPEIIRQFKSFSARRINILRGVTGKPVWQRNYYESIVRYDSDLNRIRKYIRDNPVRFRG
jgi:REP element-mobilizing transposase RayT